MRASRAVLLLLLLVACPGRRGGNTAPDAAAGQQEEASVTPTAEGPSASATSIPADSRQALVTASPAPVFSATEWPPKDPSKATDERKGVIRLGYLRKGSHVDVRANSTKKQNCAEGWYELAEGGYLCGKFLSFNEGVASAPALVQPNLDGPLPYLYGMNLTNGTPMYRRVPTRKERADSEKGLLVGRSRPGDLAKAQFEVASDGDVPWYLKDHGGQKPTVSLDELRGSGLVVMRMVKGFYVSLDHEITRPSGRFWQTESELLVPQDHVLVHKPVTEFQGVKFDAPGETRKLPIGWVLSPHAWKYRFDADKQKMRRNDKIERFTIVGLTGKRVVIENRNYFEAVEGFYLRDIDSTRTDPGPKPAEVANAKWIDINLKTQSLVAFVGDVPVYATILSSGRHDDVDKSKDHRTVTGNFSLREKHIAATMDDDSAGDGTYSIQDVPWIMYFHGSYAIHGAFWHSAFGHERSHGCVNLTPYDAHQLFEWAGPRLPAGWHGVRATEANPGTRVVIHDG